MYAKITDGALETYPYSIAQPKSANSNTSFPKTIPSDMLESYGVHTVIFADAPSINNRTQKATQDTAPTLVDGSWTIGWTTADKTTDEIAEYDNGVAEGHRITRNGLLAETDFYALSDVTMSSEMQSYRQALRDITSHSNWPHLEDADWPTAP